MPKSWSKGLTAATDARVARMAERRRGMRYQRHIKPEDRRFRSPRTLPLQWSTTMAYVVGLIATDGCLVTKGRRHIAFVSEDRQLMETYLDCLGRARRHREERTRTGKPIFRVQHSDVAFYEWLLTIGLMPRKSLIMGAIDVPDEFLRDLARGLMDGDGGILNRMVRADTHGRPGYRWECLQTRFLSASFAHIAWLQSRLVTAFRVTGYVNRFRSGHGSVMTELRFGKRESLRILPELYRSADAPRLERKWQIWHDYQMRHALVDE